MYSRCLFLPGTRFALETPRKAAAVARLSYSQFQRAFNARESRGCELFPCRLRVSLSCPRETDLHLHQAQNFDFFFRGTLSFVSFDLEPDHSKSPPSLLPIAAGIS
ncbi:hypothetical protein NC652_009424 [Populus alba x Populus x berolinensis]|nr:hypothetical protein NC652_009424 [Populus alba x Populus x berolinensis]